MAPALMLAACGMPDDPGTLQKNRPTQGDGTVFSGYGSAEVRWLDAHDGRVRVWYAMTGEHSPPQADTRPADGIPDFVALVADTADRVFTDLEDRGFRLPLSDRDDIPLADDGGSGAFDIYLVNFRRADGLYFVEGCTGTEPATCVGYIAIKNTFARSGYSSVEEGVTVLVSHETFHAVQAAYAHPLPLWFSEGTATWYQEVFDPSQQDFDRLVTEFYRHPGRALNGNAQGAADLFPYGTAVFPWFISERIDADLPRQWLASVAEGSRAEDVIMDSLGGPQAFGAIFAEFSVVQVATGSRALEGVSPAYAARAPMLPLQPLDGAGDLNWDVEVRPWASATGSLQRPRSLDLQVRPLEGWPAPPWMGVLDPTAVPMLQVVEPGGILTVPASATPLWIALANPDPDRRTAGRLAVRAEGAAAPAPPSPEAPPVEGSGTPPLDGPDTPASAPAQETGCAAVASLDRAAGPRPMLLLVVAVCFSRRRRSVGGLTASRG
jgi:hypothetical protein